MILNENFFIFVSFFIFAIGLAGLYLANRNLILILISLEIILLAVNLNFLISSLFLDDIVGQISVILILSVAGAEVSLGLALAILFYRIKKEIYIDKLNNLKG